MSRRFVNLHRINPWRCFYPTTQQALAAAENKANSVDDARLARAAISFHDPLQREGINIGDVHFASLGSSSNRIISLYPDDGNTFLFDGTSRGLRVMPALALKVHHSLAQLDGGCARWQSGAQDDQAQHWLQHGPTDVRE